MRDQIALLQGTGSNLRAVSLCPVHLFLRSTSADKDVFYFHICLQIRQQVGGGRCLSSQIGMCESAFIWRFQMYFCP